MEADRGPSETIHAYHADNEYVGHSMKEVFRRSRREYRERFINRSIASSETDALLLGHVVHAMAEGGNSFDSQYAVIPQCNRTTKAGKTIYADFLDSLGSDYKGTTIPYKVHAQALAIIGSLLDSPLHKILWGRDGVHEMTHRWVDPDTGLKRKCRFDKLVDNSLLIDLKTAAKPWPEAFARNVTGLGYYRQAAWYLDGLRDLTGDEGDFVFLVLGTTPPYEVFAYQPDPGDLMIAYEQNARSIRELASCYDSGKWSTPGADSITVLTLPDWSRRDNPYEPDEE